MGQIRNRIYYRENVFFFIVENEFRYRRKNGYIN